MALNNNINRRTNDTFLGELRKEIMDSQERRGKIVRLKLTFISSFFGLGSLDKFALNNFSLQFEYLFYIIPIIALIFDLYIMGEDFGIKRAAKFIKDRPETPKVEKDWENAVNVKRDSFSYIAFILSAFLILGICVYIVYPRGNSSGTLFWSWLAISSLTIWVNVFYKPIRNKFLA
jgi:hypothetical protein